MSSARQTTRRSTIDTDFKRSLLESIGLFRDVDLDAVSDLLSMCGRIDLEKGRTLLSPDAPNRCIYIVLAGRLSVHVGSADGTMLVELGPGSCTGEMSMIDDRDPSAYVVAAEDTPLMVISHDLLWRLIERSHTFAKNLLVVLSERVRADNAFIASSLDILREARHYAITDALTKLGNRYWMRDTFDRELRRGIKSRKPACFMMIDVDSFKRLNDRHGHIAADRVLSLIAKTLRNRLRPTDLIARFGGDEFAAFLPDADLVQAERTSERLLTAVRKLTPKGVNNTVTVSIGVTAIDTEDDLDRLIQRADAAMYEAKAAGRDRVIAKRA